MSDKDERKQILEAMIRHVKGLIAQLEKLLDSYS